MSANVAARIAEIIDESASIMSVLKEDTHYFKTMDGRPVLKKPGAEVIAKAYGFTAKFAAPQVIETSEGQHQTAHAVSVCALEDSKGITISEGAGAYPLALCGYNLNTAVKMAAKSAFIDAVIRGAALSADFTQDLASDGTPEGMIASGVNVSAVSTDQKAPRKSSAKSGVNKQAAGENDQKEQKQKEDLIKKISSMHSNPGVIATLYDVASLNELTIEELKECVNELSNAEGVTSSGSDNPDKMSITIEPEEIGGYVQL